jgi:hypothetical protein
MGRVGGICRKYERQRLVLHAGKLVGSGAEQQTTDAVELGSQNPRHLRPDSTTLWSVEAVSESTAASVPKRRRSRVLRTLGVCVILLALLIAVAPGIVANSGLRDRAINGILASPSMSASSEGASFGWFSPLSVNGLRLKSTNDHIHVSVQGITTERSLRQLLVSSPDLGTISIDSPHLEIRLPLDVKIEREKRLDLEPTCKAVVRNASLTVRVADVEEPLLEVDDVNLTVRVEATEEGRLLTLDPVVIFDKRKLSPKLASKLLHLFDPTLRDAPQIGGEVSLALNKLRIPLGLPKEQLVKRIEVEGKLGFHQVATEVNKPFGHALVHLLASMNDKHAPGVVRLIKDAEINFHVRDGRLFHDGLRLGFPDIDPDLAISSRGSIGLDETLDLQLELPRMSKARRKAKGAIKCRVTGTVQNPKIAIQDASFVLRAPQRKQPLIDVDGINLNMQVNSVKSAHVLTVDPVEVFKKQKLTGGLTSELVHLIAPDLAGNRKVTGEMSLALSKIHIPLGVARDELFKRTEVEGKVGLHQVGVEAKSPLTQALIHLLAGMYGKHPSDVVQVIKDAEINFQLRDGRMCYEGLRTGMPEIDPDLVVTSHGSIGLDETLDLHVDLPRLDRARRKEKGPIRCRVTGTIRHPKLAIQNPSLVVNLPGSGKLPLDVSNINLIFAVEHAKAGRFLTLEPVTIKKQQLTSEMADELLRLIVPDLEGLTDVDGQISMALDEFRVPLGVPRDQLNRGVELAGKLRLHRVSASLKKSPLFQTTVKVLAGMYGKRPTDIVRVARDAEVRFKVRKGRMHYEGLRVGFPDISPDLLISSRGSIGLDRSLDLVLEVPRIVLNARANQADRRTMPPFRFRVTGTAARPIVTEIR